MSWIQTYTGKKFFPLAPVVADIDIRDIAHSLALQCRFNGHSPMFYSVAEHSVRVSLAVEPDLALWGLLHDAAEAYISDVPRPVKAQMPEFSRIEDRLLCAIAKRFGLLWPVPEEIWATDLTLLATEARDLMGAPPEPWSISATPLPERIVPVNARRAEAMFLDRFHELYRVPEAR